MHIRRRTGRSKTTKEMTKYVAILAVLSNLENEDYVKTVMGEVDDFVRELQNVTDEELQEARQLISIVIPPSSAAVGCAGATFD